MKKGKESLLKLKLVISDKEMQKKRLYKIKTYDGKVKEVEWENLPSWRKEQISEGAESFRVFINMFPILVTITLIIFACITILK